MYLETLQDLGLSKNESKIYETLLGNSTLSVPQISEKTKVHKRNVYDTIPRLLHKGLIYLVIGSSETRYAAVSPDKLADLVWEKQSKLEKILPGLKKQFKKTTAEEAVYVYKGKEGFKNYLRDILKVGEDVYFIGAKGGWFDKDLNTYVIRFLNQAKKQKIKYYHLFDNDVKTKAPELLRALGKPYKFLPPQYSTTGAIDIFGDKIVTFSGLSLKNISEDVTLAVIVNQELADCYRTWFRFMWDFCPQEK